MEKHSRPRLILSGLLFFLPLQVQSAPKNPERRLSRDKSFSYALPKGYRADSVDKESSARWTRPATGTHMRMMRIKAFQARTRYENSSLKAAKKERAAFKPETHRKIFSKVYKKTLASGLKYYFFTHKNSKASPRQNVTGFIFIGKSLYRVEGAETSGGMEGLYRILGSIRPVHRPKYKRQFNPAGKPAVIQAQEEDAGVPLY